MEIRDVVLYARVSKANCHQDPELQLQPLRLMCQMKGWRIVHEYVDRGWSGAKESRPRLDELMLDVTKGLEAEIVMLLLLMPTLTIPAPEMLRTLLNVPDELFVVLPTPDRDTVLNAALLLISITLAPLLVTTMPGPAEMEIEPVLVDVPAPKALTRLP